MLKGKCSLRNTAFTIIYSVGIHVLEGHPIYEVLLPPLVMCWTLVSSFGCTLQEAQEADTLTPLPGEDSEASQA